MFTVTNASKSYAGRVLFENVSLQVNRGDRIGLVGPNGAGKSTLFSLILGQITPDTGTVAFQKGTTLGYLPQESAPTGPETVLETATAINPEFVAARALVHKHEAGDPSVSQAQYHDALATLDHYDFYLIEPKAKKILAGLAFRESDFNRPLRELSGGWIMRAHLARLLVMEPDLLMLDEPTNHLDLESLVWFQNHLEQYSGAILMISHDREFLNHLIDTVLEISHSKLIRYRGNYDEFLEQKAARQEQHLAAYKNQQKEIESLQRFADRFRAKASKASQAQSKLKQIERMEKIEAPLDSRKKIHFQFPQPARSGIKTLSLSQVDHAYGDLQVYKGLDFTSERGQRIVLVGPNGAGKSTLLKLLAGVLPIQKGERTLGHQVEVGYFAQHRVEMLHSKRTVLEEAADLPQPVADQTVRTILGAFLFSGDDAFKPVAVLSGGEKSRLALAKLLLSPPNVLLMDEPTTHLDMDSIEALIGALEQYPGTLIFISHDVYFIRKIATSVIRVENGVLHHFPGNFDEYLERSSAKSAKEAVAGSSPAASTPSLTNSQPDMQPETSNAPAPVSTRKTKEQKRKEAEERQTRSRQRKALEEKVAKIEADVIQLEKESAEIVTQLEDPTTHEAPNKAFELNRRLVTVTEKIESLSRQWEELATQMQPETCNGKE